jgi:predicted AAA+ superfamily ATPase
MKQVSEFLTGRIALVELCPLSAEEIPSSSLDKLWLMGGFPDGGILHRKRFPVWQNNYLEALAMRDLPAWGLPGKPAMTKRFFKMLAAVNGGPWNASQIGKSMGLSYHTTLSKPFSFAGFSRIRPTSENAWLKDRKCTGGIPGSCTPF